MSNIIPFPQQPGLRSFIIYDDVPEGCLVHEMADDTSAPHLHENEFIVVDPSDCDPVHGDMFLAQWSTGRRQPVECIWSKGWGGWMLAPIKPQDMIRVSDGKTMGQLRMMDGPYKAGVPLRCFVGKIVGIYEPDFRKKLKRAA